MDVHEATIKLEAARIVVNSLDSTPEQKQTALEYLVSVFKETK